MKGSVSIEVLLLSFVILAGIVVMAYQVSKITSMARLTDPLLMAKSAGMKVLSGILSVRSCGTCTYDVDFYLPKGGVLEINGGELKVMVYDRLAYRVKVPVSTDRNVLGEGWHTLRIMGTSSGVEVS